MSRARHAVLASAVYLALSAAYSWPLLAQARDRIVADPYDPVLNASILWWNAIVVPFTSAWWTPPFFHPSVNVAAFTENLTGLSRMVRAFAQHRPPTPWKVWYLAPHFRYERPQKGRFRQFHQIGAEVLPFREIFAILFFVSVGMLVNPGYILENVGAILALTGLIVLGKALITILFGFVLPWPASTTLILA